ncbi:MAG: flagellar hook protein FlgE [Betaproteobacteria bacterium]|nr:flagellar hook protein FlgE [Betaproteobacteria bacterium]
MAFQQGLSGLNTSARALDVIGNNIANSNTVGFKGSDAHFGDVYAAALNGGGAGQIGIGVSLMNVAQRFTQGNISITSNPLDIAINGGGFFRLSNNGAITYTRNGQFHLDKDGAIVNDQGLYLTGYLGNTAGTINRQTPTELRLTADQLKLAPVPTGGSTGGIGYAGVQMGVNIDSRSPEMTWVPPIGPTPMIDPNDYNWTTGLTIYDSLGNPHIMNFYFVRTANTGEWDMYGNVDGTAMDGAGDSPNLTTPIVLQFDDKGQLTSINGTPTPPMEIPVSIDLTQVASNLGRPDWGATSPLTFNVDLSGTTQYGSPFVTNRLMQDGYSSGDLVGLGVNETGVVQGRYTNGQTRNLAQVVLAYFENPNGLTNIGNNQWIETYSSGQPTVDTPKSGRLGVLQSERVEDSNVDLTDELVKMIIQQRSYQANAQTIKTQDQIMQTIVNIR